MRRTTLRIGAELVPLLLVLGSLALALGLIVQAHRRMIAPKVTKAPKPAAIAPVVERKPAPAVILPPDPTPKPEPEPEPVDPTPAVLAEIQTNLDEQRAAATKSDAEAKRLDAARKSLAERTEGWKRRQMLAKDQLDRVDKAVATLEQQADVLARMRDVLAAKRDHEKVELAAARSRSGVAILPYKGINGTWRLPIVIECRNGTATLQPNGPSFSLVELSGVFSSRGSPIARAVALRLMQLQNIESPDGEIVVPYLLFVIRPDGIRPYYEARGRLEPLGITFGYELVDADLDIDFPDLADVSEWSDTPHKKKPGPTDGEFAWPADRPGFGGKNGKDSEFVWPTAETYSAGEFPRQGRPGRTPFDPNAGPGIRSLGSDGRRAMPGRLDRGGVYPGGIGPTPGSLKPGRVELTTEDLVAAMEEEMYGSRPNASNPVGGPSAPGTGFDPLAEPSAPAPLAFEPGEGGGNRVRNPFAEPSAPAPISSGPGRYAQPGTGEPGRPARAMPGNPRSTPTPSGGSRPALGTIDQFARGDGLLPRGAQSDPAANPSIGGYGAAFTPPEGLPPGMSGTSESAQNEGSNPANLGGVANPAGGGGGQGQGTHGATSPGLVNMSLTGGARASAGSASSSSGAGQPGQTVIPGSEGDGDGDLAGALAGSVTPSETYRKRRNLEMTIACGPSGLTVHPGGYRLSAASLDADKGMLDKVLHGIVRNHQRKDPKSDWMPRLKYLIEPGGEMSYQKAREQTVTGASGWPAYWKLSEGSPLKIAIEEKNPR